MENREDEKEEKPFVLFGHEVARKKAYAIGAGLVCAALLIGGGGYAIANAGWNGGRQEEKLEDNIKKNPNADADAVEKETEKAEESAKSEESEAKGDNGKAEGTGDTDSSKKDDGNKGGSSQNSDSSKTSGGSQSSGGSTKKDDTPSKGHEHNWVAQTKTVHHDAVTHQEAYTVHHDAVTYQVWHDAVGEYRSICNNCGEDITGHESSHMKNSLLNGGNCGSCSNVWVTTKQGYYETVTDQAAWDETKYKTVTDKAAYDETVTTGYKCPTCGATRSN